MARLDGQRALFVVPDRFSEVEYDIPRRLLEELGVVVTVASWTADAVTGSRGDAVQPEVLLGDVNAGDYDAIVFIGGSGVQTGDPDTQRIVQEAVAESKVVAAICAAQGILTRAGLLENERPGGVYVVRDGDIIAASGPIKAREFGETIAAALGE
jgi:protease I